MADFNGQRLDIFLASQIACTRSQTKNLIDGGLVLANGAIVKHGYKVRYGDIIEVKKFASSEPYLVPIALPIDVIFEDEHLIVVNKPPGIVMYPAIGISEPTLLSGILHHTKRLPDIGPQIRAGVVHRIDKDTSGLVVIALDRPSYYGLIDQFKERSIERLYLAIVHGRIKDERGEITAPTGRSVTDRKKMSTRTNRPRPTVTRWEVVTRYRNATAIHAKLLTGRTHQIRVHLTSIGHPLLGDRTYGSRTTAEIGRGRIIDIPRQMLHAKILGFVHPVTNEPLRLVSPFPSDMQTVMDELEKDYIAIT